MKIKNKNTNFIDPRVDEYITLLLNFADKYKINNQAKKILNNVIYLLLNKDFQYAIRSIRLTLFMPIDGFKNQKEFNLWQDKFEEIIKKYHEGEKILEDTSTLLKIIEKDIGSSLLDRKPELKKSATICETVIFQSCYMFGGYFGLKDTKNRGYWMAVVIEILIFNSPRTLISHLHKWSKVFGADSIVWKRKGDTFEMTITLYPDTKFKDIERLIESSKKRTLELLNKIRKSAKKNESKTDDIKRDYFIYKTYLNQQTYRRRGEKIYSNISKSDAVKKIAETMLDKKEQSAKHLETDSIRKIVNRMKKRIKEAYVEEK